MFKLGYVLLCLYAILVTYDVEARDSNAWIIVTKLGLELKRPFVSQAKHQLYTTSPYNVVSLSKVHLISGSRAQA